MIETNTLMASVKAQISARYPQNPVYQDFIPKDFQRPCFTLECQKVERTDLNIGLVRWTVTLLVTCFTAVNEYGDSSRAELIDRQDGILALFSSGPLHVGNRSLTAQAKQGAGDPSAAEVKVVFSWVDARPEYRDPESGDTPRMEQIQLNVNGKE